MTLKRLGLMALVGIPMMLIYFMLRAEVFRHFGTTEDIVAALAIGAGSAFLADYMWPRQDEDDDRS